MPPGYCPAGASRLLPGGCLYCPAGASSESCTKAPVAPAGYKFTQGKDNSGSNIHCATLGDVTGQMGEASGSWPELAALCSAISGSAAVSLHTSDINYEFCLKSGGGASRPAPTRCRRPAWESSSRRATWGTAKRTGEQHCG